MLNKGYTLTIQEENKLLLACGSSVDEQTIELLKLRFQELKKHSDIYKTIMKDGGEIACFSPATGRLEIIVNGTNIIYIDL